MWMKFWKEMRKKRGRGAFPFHCLLGSSTENLGTTFFSINLLTVLYLQTLPFPLITQFHDIIIIGLKIVWFLSGRVSTPLHANGRRYGLLLKTQPQLEYQMAHVGEDNSIWLGDLATVHILPWLWGQRSWWALPGIPGKKEKKLGTPAQPINR